MFHSKYSDIIQTISGGVRPSRVGGGWTAVVLRCVASCVRSRHWLRFYPAGLRRGWSTAAIGRGGWRRCVLGWFWGFLVFFWGGEGKKWDRMTDRGLWWHHTPWVTVRKHLSGGGLFLFTSSDSPLWLDGEPACDTGPDFHTICCDASLTGDSGGSHWVPLKNVLQNFFFLNWTKSRKWKVENTLRSAGETLMSKLNRGKQINLRNQWGITLFI